MQQHVGRGHEQDVVVDGQTLRGQGAAEEGAQEGVEGRHGAGGGLVMSELDAARGIGRGVRGRSRGVRSRRSRPGWAVGLAIPQWVRTMRVGCELGGAGLVEYMCDSSFPSSCSDQSSKMLVSISSRTELECSRAFLSQLDSR